MLIQTSLPAEPACLQAIHSWTRSWHQPWWLLFPCELVNAIHESQRVSFYGDGTRGARAQGVPRVLGMAEWRVA